jgi:hypothetical protein
MNKRELFCRSVLIYFISNSNFFLQFQGGGGGAKKASSKKNKNKRETKF